MVVCDNHFPDPIVRFAQRLDEILSAAAGTNLQWWPVPQQEWGRHEVELWTATRACLTDRVGP